MPRDKHVSAIVAAISRALPATPAAAAPASPPFATPSSFCCSTAAAAQPLALHRPHPQLDSERINQTSTKCTRFIYKYLRRGSHDFTKGSK